MRAEGQWVIRHGDTCTLNNGNCPGEYIHVKSTKMHPAPDGNDEDVDWPGDYLDRGEGSGVVARRLEEERGQAPRH